MKEKHKLICTNPNCLGTGNKDWEHDQDVKAILKSLKPNNDICERILGLKDYLSKTLYQICIRCHNLTLVS